MDESGSALDTIGHHRRIVTNALVKLLPGGGSFAELYNAYVPTRRTKRQIEFIAALERKVERLGTRIDQSRIFTEPYADLFEDVMATVATRQGLEKREYYASVLANALTPEAPEYDRQLRMVACLDELRPSHLRMLAMLVADLERRRTNNPGGGAGASVEIPDADDANLHEDHADLLRWDVFDRGTVGFAGIQGRNYLTATLTAFGKDFAAFIGSETAGADRE